VLVDIKARRDVVDTTTVVQSLLNLLVISSLSHVGLVAARDGCHEPLAKRVMAQERKSDDD
jgi:hypothetical protein